MTEELIVKPSRKTLIQTAIILNVSKFTVRRMADKGELEWSDGQITIESIKKYIQQAKGKRKYEETDEQIKEKIQQAEKKTTGIRTKSSSWVKNW